MASADGATAGGRTGRGRGGALTRRWAEARCRWRRGGMFSRGAPHGRSNGHTARLCQAAGPTAPAAVTREGV
eukprot:7218806-Pyramimonas_sp.AAC.2